MASTKLEVQEKVLQFEGFINNVLKEDLKQIHNRWEAVTSEIAEWQQLKTMIQTMHENDMSSFKGKMDIGINIYAQVFVPDTSKIIIDIGAGVFMEFTLEEALRFIESRISRSEKHLAGINDAACSVKARIKLVLHGIQELEQIK